MTAAEAVDNRDFHAVRQTLTRLAALGTLSRFAGEGGTRRVSGGRVRAASPASDTGY